MKRWLATIGIMLIIAAGVIWEQVYVTQTFRTLSQQLAPLLVQVMACPDDAVDTPENIAAINTMYQTWRQKERTLCYLVRHTETFQISDTILYAQNFIQRGNQEEALLALNKLQYLFDVYHYNLGTSLENII